MKVLLVIHGYPHQYSGGSEVYTQTLAHGLQNAGCGVSVFAREEDPFLPDCNLRIAADPIRKEIDVYLVNYPRAVTRYQNDGIDRILGQILDRTKPDLVHFGHLNHLSTNLPLVAKSRGLPVLFTLHDFWLMCPRGQFLKSGVTNDEPWQLCSGQANKKCASQCFNRYGGDTESSRSGGYWEQWIADRMSAVRQACTAVDLFIAPSRHLMGRHIKEFGLEEKRVVYMDYGFELGRLRHRRRNKLDRKKGFVFGYIGRHHPSKGIHLLIDAFCALKEPPRLRIWGKPAGQLTAALKRRARTYSTSANSIEWMGDYHNEDIVAKVFNYCDCIVVPSIWDENSPLVIHESQQCGVPVITANHGGMKEYVRNGINGITFAHRSASSLRNAMHKAMADPDKLDAISKRGYLFSENRQVPSLEIHIEEILKHYSHLISAQHSTANTMKSGNSLKSNLKQMTVPWRITFDTNPDDCNLSCIMCEEHSIYSPKRMIRIANRTPHRRMAIETIESVMAECAPLGLREIIPSTMGEPLVYKHMRRIIELCHQYNVRLNLTTNGTFPKLGVQKWAELIVPVGSDVKISWNGADPESQKAVMHRNDFKKNLSNLRAFIQARNTPSLNKGNYCSVTLQMTFMEINLNQIPRVVELAIAEGVDRVKGHHLWVLFKEIKNQDLRRNRHSIGRWNKIVQECHNIADGNLLPNGKKIRLDNIYELGSKFNTVSQDAICPFLGKEVWVNHEGVFNPCCAPDDLRLQLGSFDNVKNKGLLAVWNSDKYRNLVKHYLDNEICQNCTMRVPPAKYAS